jgi:hypothetical protein
MTATRFAKGATLVGLVAAWLAAAWLLTRTTIPGNLHLPHVDAGRIFPVDVLDRSARYDGLLRWLWLAGTLATVAALAVFAWLGPRLARAWELGRVGKGVMVGAVTTLGTWAVGLPFGAIALWWGRRYGQEQQGYLSWALDQWPGLLGQVVGLTIALTILLLLAGRFGRRWWLVAGLPLGHVPRRPLLDARDRRRRRARVRSCRAPSHLEGPGLVAAPDRARVLRGRVGDTPSRRPGAP